MKNKFVYKIRNKKTGLFSTGGMDPKWKPKGKIWVSIGAVKIHLSQFKKWDCETYRSVKDGLVSEDWEVLEFNIDPTRIIDAREFVKE